MLLGTVRVMNSQCEMRYMTVLREVDYAEVTVPSDISLLDTEAVLTLAADARFGRLLSSPTDDSAELELEARWKDALSKMREAVRRAVSRGTLKLRDINGIVTEHANPRASPVYVDRSEFVQFALDELRVKVVQGPATDSLGRYSLERAAGVIAANGADKSEVLAKLKAAARCESLSVYAAASTAPMRLADKTVVRSYGFARWFDLNAWLAENEPHLAFRFAPPEDPYLSRIAHRDVEHSSNHHKPGSAWKEKALEIADQVAQEMYRRGTLQISQHAVSKVVAKRLANLDGNKYWGKRGPREANTIRNEALKGWSFRAPGNAD